MKFFILAFLLSYKLCGQPSLIIETGVVFQLTGDTFILDSLIMKDNSTLVLDNRHATNMIRVKFLSIGSNCLISGSGREGENGADGEDGIARSITIAGKKGKTGFSGTNLILDISKLSVSGYFSIELSGGKGGDGGKGGIITQETNSNTKNINVTFLNEQRKRAVGGNGGDGGNGGNVTISYFIEWDEIIKEKIKLYNKGGEGGISGKNKEQGISDWYGPERNGTAGWDGTIKLLPLKQ